VVCGAGWREETDTPTLIKNVEAESTPKPEEVVFPKVVELMGIEPTTS